VDVNYEGKAVADKLAEDIYSKTRNKDYNADAVVVAEDEEKRTATDKRFLMSDGSYTLASFQEDMHYFEDGKYKDIDDTLEKSSDGIYRNKENGLKVEIPEVYGENFKTKVSVGGGVRYGFLNTEKFHGRQQRCANLFIKSSPAVITGAAKGSIYRAVLVIIMLCMRF
jgi:hypothetical protein